MKMYRTETAISFHHGTILELAEKQSKPRLMVGQIRALKEKGKFEVVTSVEFKAGEMIGIEQEIPKGLAPKLKSLSEEKKAFSMPEGGEIKEKSKK